MGGENEPRFDPDLMWIHSLKLGFRAKFLSKLDLGHLAALGIFQCRFKSRHMRKNPIFSKASWPMWLLIKIPRNNNEGLCSTRAQLFLPNQEQGRHRSNHHSSCAKTKGIWILLDLSHSIVDHLDPQAPTSTNVGLNVWYFCLFTISNFSKKPIYETQKTQSRRNLILRYGELHIITKSKVGQIRCEY